MDTSRDGKKDEHGARLGLRAETPTPRVGERTRKLDLPKLSYSNDSNTVELVAMFIGFLIGVAFALWIVWDVLRQLTGN